MKDSKNNVLRDSNGDTIEVSDTVIMPEPNSDDLYTFGGWQGFVEDFDASNPGNILVTDGECDFHSIEAHRVELVK